jgi:cytochrome b561
MPARNTALRYGNVAMSFHWIIALLVIANICAGLYMGELPRSDPNKFIIFQTHKSIGLTVLVLSVLRLLWRLVNPVPPLPAGMNTVLRFGAHASHFALYFLIVFIPLTGYLLVSASPLGNGTLYFGLFDWPNLPFFTGMTREQLHPIHENFETAHVILAWSAIVLVPIHICAALYHYFFRHDGVLQRMWFGTTVEPQA